jgi:hypothetical protein
MVLKWKGAEIEPNKKIDAKNKPAPGWLILLRTSGS